MQKTSFASKNTTGQMKKADVILGLQWGDEGKGKVVDVLTPRYEVDDLQRSYSV